MQNGQLKLFSGSAHPQLAKEIADQLGISLGRSKLERFSDSEVSFQIDENIRGTDVFILQPTCTPVDPNFVELCVMIDAFRRSSASRITAVMPAIATVVSRSCRRTLEGSSARGRTPSG